MFCPQFKQFYSRLPHSNRFKKNKIDIFLKKTLNNNKHNLLCNIKNIIILLINNGQIINYLN